MVPSPDPGRFSSSSLSFDDFQKQASLMTSCTLLWKELSDHFTSLEKDLLNKSDALKQKMETFDLNTEEYLAKLSNREVTIRDTVQAEITKLEAGKKAAMLALEKREEANFDGDVDNDTGLLMKLKGFCFRMDSNGFWRFIIIKKKELDALRSQIPLALAKCIDPPRFVLEAISEVFPVDKRMKKRENDLGWACVLVLESLIPLVVDPVLGKSRLLVTPTMRERANQIAETWKESLAERGGIENVKTPDLHTFLQHLVTFGIFKKEDVDLYRKLVIGSAWRKQMPKLALAVGLEEKMPDMIEELINKGQQIDAIHFTYEASLVDKFPTVPLLKTFLRNAKKATGTVSEAQNSNTQAASNVAVRKEQSALRAVIKCIEEYKLEKEFPPQSLRKRLDQLEKVSKRPAVASPANKRTRASNGGPMPPAKAGRSTNAYVSSYPIPPPAFARSPSQVHYPHGVLPSPYSYGSRSPPSPATPYVYSPEAASSALAGSYYSPYYGNHLSPMPYQHAYYG